MVNNLLQQIFFNKNNDKIKRIFILILEKITFLLIDIIFNKTF